MSKPITLITGTRKGIGRHLAEYYVQRGHLVIGCSRGENETFLENYDHFSVDVADEKNVKKMFLSIRERYGKLDHLINNAGIASMNHTLLTPLTTVNNILNTNLVGTFLFCREAAKLMLSNKFGRIINFTTVATPLKLEGEAIYAASKAAVLSLTQILSRELAEFGVTVNSIGPNPIETDLIRSVQQEKMQRLLQRQAIPRFGVFEDVTNIIDFYIKRESNFITGQNLYLGGVC